MTIFSYNCPNDNAIARSENPPSLLSATLQCPWGAQCALFYTQHLEVSDVSTGHRHCTGRRVILPFIANPLLHPQNPENRHVREVGTRGWARDNAVVPVTLMYPIEFQLQFLTCACQVLGVAWGMGILLGDSG